MAQYSYKNYSSPFFYRQRIWQINILWTANPKVLHNLEKLFFFAYNNYKDRSETLTNENVLTIRQGGRMKRETEIDIAAAGAVGSKYDEACKRLFQNREIIAPVLKEVVPEYKNFTVEEVTRYIDADSIKDVPVGDIPARVEQLSTEMESVSDKLIRYDTHFKAVNPMLSNENLCIQLHIDLEVQNSYRPSNPSYPIVKRGIYYAAREISYQLGTLTGKTNYGDIEKVYSIWICNEEIPVKLQNTVTMYSIKKQDTIGRSDEPEEDYNLMNVIIIRRGTETDVPIFDYLSGVFQCDKSKISKYVNIQENEAVLKGVEDMSGLGQSIMRDAMKQGMQQGMQQGMKQGEFTGGTGNGSFGNSTKRAGEIFRADEKLRYGIRYMMWQDLTIMTGSATFCVLR